MTDLPRMGDNIDAPYGTSITERLEQDYGELLGKAKILLDEAKEMPSVVESAIDVAVVADLIKMMRDAAARAEHHRVAEKEPYLRDGDAVHTFFTKRAIEPLDRERKNLQARLDAYKQRQLAEERQRRAAEAAEARRQQQEAQKAREEAEAAARRARSIETQTARQIEAATARVEDDMATAKAEEKTLATMATAGSMVRERFEGERPGQVTMRKVPVVFIEDASKLDLEALRPYLKEEHLLSALRQWAKATNYASEMPGATVGMRETTMVR